MNEITSGLVSQVYDTVVDEVELIPTGLILKTLSYDATTYNEMNVNWYSFIHEMRMFILSKGYDMSLSIYVDNDGDETIRYQVELRRIERFSNSMWTSYQVNELLLDVNEIDVMVKTCKWVISCSRYED
jgi:hypothetical protein